MSDWMTEVRRLAMESLRPPKEHSPEGSINHYTNSLPLRRWPHESKGKVLHLPRCRMTVVPYESTGGGWNCVVVEPDPAGVYQPDGYSLFIGDAEIATAIEMKVGAPVPWKPEDAIAE